MSARETLIVFVKHPEPGRVKTRLAAGIGAERAADVYRALAERTVATARAACGGVRRVTLAVDPPERVVDVRRWLGPDLHAVPQRAGDLGARMCGAFDEAFADGARRVVVVGTDCPALSRTDIDDAFAELAAHDSVLGPAVDGGYWLVGLSAPRPSLFAEMPWSGPEVLSRTTDRLRAEGARFALLRTLRDLDTPDDHAALARLLGEPAGRASERPASKETSP